MTEILEGSLLATAIREKAQARIDTDATHPPGLAVILVGTDAASGIYVGLKEQAARDVGIYVEKLTFEKTTTTALLEKINELNARPDIHGILVQLPLPKGLNTDKIIAAINPLKDVDGFHPTNRAALLNNQPRLVPPVALGIMRLIQATRQPLTGKNAVIVGKSEIFSEPIIELLKDSGVTANFISYTQENLGSITLAADIIVVAVGEPDFLKSDMVHEGAIIIDVGTNRQPDGKVVGDVSKEAAAKASFVSKNPGGVGPLTVAYLLMNVIKAQGLLK
jgi:methylenetetrahydrofolate dehydrogenase (NADP+)/methenyltetrahydrofolate cyclohydrolase